ncbi:metal-dependent hydrolase [Candidatus Aenigmatarchaeota archaeon]
MKIKYFGHACFSIDKFIIDPYISKNPNCNAKITDIKSKYILITHDHHDHIGDAFEIAKNNDAVIIAMHEIAEKAIESSLQAEGMNIGGWIRIGGWKIKMVNAQHSSLTGHPAGFIIKRNKTLYHSGDTGLFSDMTLIGDEGINIAMLPIGDRYTMGIDDAIKAVGLVRPKVVIPMHYDTFPAIPANPKEFKEKCEKKTMTRVEIIGYNKEKEFK